MHNVANYSLKDDSIHWCICFFRGIWFYLL